MLNECRIWKIRMALWMENILNKSMHSENIPVEIVGDKRIFYCITLLCDMCYGIDKQSWFLPSPLEWRELWKTMAFPLNNFSLVSLVLNRTFPLQALRKCEKISEWCTLRGILSVFLEYCFYCSFQKLHEYLESIKFIMIIKYLIVEQMFKLFEWPNSN